MSEEEYKIEDFRATTRLLFENEELQQRIDKAIEIIKSHKDYEDEGLLVEETIELLEILGDKE